MKYGPGRFQACKLITNDIEKLAPFYEAVYGMKRSEPILATVHGSDIKEYWFTYEDGTGCIFLMIEYLTGDVKHTGNDGVFVCQTDDVNAFVERALANGATMLQEPIDFPEVNVRCVFMYDPEGHIIEAVQEINPT